MNATEEHTARMAGPLSKHEYTELRKLTGMLPDRQPLNGPRDLGKLTPQMEARRRALEVRLDIWGPP